MSIAAMKQALEVLEWCTSANPCASEATINALREAIAAAEAKATTSSPWFRVIDEELVSIDIDASPDNSYEEAKKMLNQLICWHVNAACDPDVNGGFHLVPSTICPHCGGDVRAE